MNLSSLLAVFQFEWRRSFSGFRIAAWLVLALFTPAVILLLQSNSASVPPNYIFGTIIFYLVVEVTCLLGLLLWAAPMIQSELESNSWIYCAVRPYGRIHVLLGKYCNAIAWVFLAAATAVSITSRFVTMVEVGQFWRVAMVLILLGCMTYGALFALMAVLFPNRAMVVAVVYTIVFEGFMGFIPATINQLTVQYRLRSLLVGWMGWTDQLPTEWLLSISGAPPVQDVLILIATTIGLLGISCFFIGYREYITGRHD